MNKKAMVATVASHSRAKLNLATGPIARSPSDNICPPIRIFLMPTALIRKRTVCAHFSRLCIINDIVF